MCFVSGCGLVHEPGSGLEDIIAVPYEDAPDAYEVRLDHLPVAPFHQVMKCDEDNNTLRIPPVECRE